MQAIHNSYNGTKQNFKQYIEHAFSLGFSS
jgi:hypothetical protein